MHTVRIAHNRKTQTDDAIQAYLIANRHSSVDEAVDEIFALGVTVMLAMQTNQGKPDAESRVCLPGVDLSQA